jgi:predicted cupin superfamily sugar epimerase
LCLQEHYRAPVLPQSALSRAHQGDRNASTAIYFPLRCEVANGFSLVGCTVAPGFDFQDFKLDDRVALLKLFPQHARLIEEMTFDRSGA